MHTKKKERKMMKEKKMAIIYFHNDFNCMSQVIVKHFSVYCNSSTIQNKNTETDFFLTFIFNLNIGQ